jgi:hypothetical protein
MLTAVGLIDFQLMCKTSRFERVRKYIFRDSGTRKLIPFPLSRSHYHVTVAHEAFLSPRRLVVDVDSTIITPCDTANVLRLWMNESSYVGHGTVSFSDIGFLLSVRGVFKPALRHFHTAHIFVTSGGTDRRTQGCRPTGRQTDSSWQTTEYLFL